MAAALVILSGGPAPAETLHPPLPPPRPTQEGPAKPSGEHEVSQKPEAEGPEDKCLEHLSELGVRFVKQPPVHEGACNVGDPVLVSSLPGDVALSPPALMTCPAVEELVRWTKDVLAPEAKRQFESEPTKLLIGTSYQCRDQRSGGKLSEHAFGNAVDIMGIEFADRAPLPIGFQPEGSKSAEFQSAVRKGACPIFTTVLGPGTDPDHRNHLHLDLRQRKRDYRICE